MAAGIIRTRVEDREFMGAKIGFVWVLFFFFAAELVCPQGDEANRERTKP